MLKHSHLNHNKDKHQFKHTANKINKANLKHSMRGGQRL